MTKQQIKLRPSESLFADRQGDLFEKSYEEQLAERNNQPVECLGMTFENDEKRREYFLKKLHEKLKDPEFRKIEGFPIGEDEDILALSDPPYYTACPNPFIKDFIKQYGKPYNPEVPYHREPFAVDVSVGKTDALYKAHSYHTKVPHLAIVPSILHYTEPGDIVLDGFCSSGLTGVAAQWCEMAPQVYRTELEAQWKKDGLGNPRWGARRAILNDLSPAATFIAANYNLPFDVDEFARAGQRILDEVEAELGWMYETAHTDGSIHPIEYTVWSEIFSCPECTGSAAEFYAGLEQRFPSRDGMYFLPDQAAEYDRKRMTVKEILQLQLFVSDEASAIQWLKQQLTKKPQTFQEIHPQFLKEIGGWQKHEKALELSELLEQNFLRYEGRGEVSSQIHSYLSTNFKELRNLSKDDPALKAKGKDRWYVPDPNKAGDLEKLRERSLLKEFEEYHESKQKRLKVFRLEAVRAGFKKAWQERDYATIIAVASKIPENVLQEDPKLLMWYDQAVTRTGMRD